MRSQLLPSIDTLLRWRDEEGLSQAQIAKRVNEQNAGAMGDLYRPVTRSAVSVALQRAGQTGHLRQRYAEEIPWSPIRPEHKNQYPHSMLRLWARSKIGEKLTERQQRNLDNFTARHKAAGTVVTYNPQGGGFTAVPARPGIDEGLIRHPDK